VKLTFMKISYPVPHLNMFDYDAELKVLDVNLQHGLKAIPRSLFAMGMVLNV
jgi:hypothetical protein